VVKKGETLFSIARMYDLPVDELKRINNITGMPQLKAGEKIRVPALTSARDGAGDKSS
ncbi:MAG: LysM peptidoglycan-binding domain-containing protein, partial [Desulfobacterota bacterium]|nr:LysM peptidoglycan-binding domain-containing protein [Thermodesulfobacteriota bacterium]